MKNTTDANLLDLQTSVPLLGLSESELSARAVAWGQPSYRGKQLHQWIYQKGARSLTEITVFSKALREELTDICIGRSRVVHRATATDKTIKYLLELNDGQIIETVGIPTEKRLTVCVSSQVGCAMGCDFCATGKGGFVRHLSPSEILDQILTVREDFGRRVSHVVFMGMGEPLANLDSVVRATHSIGRDLEIGARNITISTVGLPGKIRQLARYKLQSTLAVSLHAPNQKLRSQLIPTAESYSLDALLEECRDYVRQTGRRLSFEYALLAGTNDRPEHATQLAQLTRGFQCHVNLIPYNPIREAPYRRPDRDRINQFVRLLQQRHVAVSVRYSRGLDADAACGQLRRRKRASLNPEIENCSTNISL